ncbi:hypothetical protein [Siminovitchia sp. 179-K 8D1 HS]|uniref:hypothetical protein n=1 Tax=Siminovitchia sp. 179-K 8D1 HS TaxID=3142385 RepID=UPI0039A27C2A
MNYLEEFLLLKAESSSQIPMKLAALVHVFLLLKRIKRLIRIYLSLRQGTAPEKNEGQADWKKSLLPCLNYKDG